MSSLQELEESNRQKYIDESVSLCELMICATKTGAMQNVSKDNIENINSVLREICNVKISPKQAEELFPNAGKHRIRNVLYRKIIPQKLATKITENTSMVPISVWKRFLG